MLSYIYFNILVNYSKFNTIYKFLSFSCWPLSRSFLLPRATIFFVRFMFLSLNVYWYLLMLLMFKHHISLLPLLRLYISNVNSVNYKSYSIINWIQLLQLFFVYSSHLSLSLFFDLFFGQQSFMHVVMQSFSQCLLMFIINVQTSHIWIDGWGMKSCDWFPCWMMTIGIAKQDPTKEGILSC